MSSGTSTLPRTKARRKIKSLKRTSCLEFHFPCFQLELSFCFLLPLLCSFLSKLDAVLTILLLKLEILRYLESWHGDIEAFFVGEFDFSVLP